MRDSPTLRLLLPILLALAVVTGQARAQDEGSDETAPAADSQPDRAEDDGPQVIGESQAARADDDSATEPDAARTAEQPAPDDTTDSAGREDGNRAGSKVVASVNSSDARSGAPTVIELPEDESVEDISSTDEDTSEADTDGQDARDESGDPAPRPSGDTATAAIKTLPETEPARAKPFRLLSGEVLPGTTARLAWSPDIQIAGLSQPTPVLVVNGDKPGPVMCMTAAVHGDELNGIEIIRRVIYDLEPEELSGTVVGIPIVNLQGFQQGSRYLADRRDLNRYFPGSEEGSLAHRIAHSLFEQVVLNCDMLVDIHTGSLKRTNLPQLRADMENPEVAEMSKGFDAMVVVHSSGGPGMLRTAATEAGVPAVTMEVGESMRIQEEHIEAGVNSLVSLMEKQGMTARLFQWSKPEPVYYQSHWVRAQQGGILFSDVKLGAYVTEGTVLGTVSDPITNEEHNIRADADGRVIGMAVDQVVMAGFAAYHLGSRAETEEEVE